MGAKAALAFIITRNRSETLQPGWASKPLLVIIQVLTLVYSPACWSSEDNQPEATRRQQIGSIDRKLMLEFIKLARFNIRFHQQANWHPQWRTLTYAAGRESGTAVSLA